LKSEASAAPIWLRLTVRSGKHFAGVDTDGLGRRGRRAGVALDVVQVVDQDEIGDFGLIDEADAQVGLRGGVSIRTR